MNNQLLNEAIDSRTTVSSELGYPMEEKFAMLEHVKISNLGYIVRLKFRVKNIPKKFLELIMVEVIYTFRFVKMILYASIGLSSIQSN